MKFPALYLKDLFRLRLSLTGRYDLLCEMKQKHPILFCLFYKKRFKEIVARINALDRILAEHRVRMVVICE